MKKIEEALFDAGQQAVFEADKDNIMNLFHLYWFSSLTFKKHCSRSSQILNYLKSIAKTRLTEIDDSNDLAAITKYAANSGGITPATVALITKFLFLLKTKSKDIIIDEALVRQWFVGTHIDLPSDPHLKKARKDFIAGATLVDIFEDVLKYFKANNKNLKNNDITPLLKYFSFRIVQYKLKGTIKSTSSVPASQAASDKTTSVGDATTDAIDAAEKKEELSNKLDLVKILTHVEDLNKNGPLRDVNQLQDRNRVVAGLLWQPNGRIFSILDNSIANNPALLAPYVEDEWDEFIKLPYDKMTLPHPAYLRSYFVYMLQFFINRKDMIRLSRDFKIFKPLLIESLSHKNDIFNAVIAQAGFLISGNTELSKFFLKLIFSQKAVVTYTLNIITPIPRDVSFDFSNVSKTDDLFKTLDNSTNFCRVVNEVVDRFSYLDFKGSLVDPKKAIGRYNTILNKSIEIYVTCKYFEAKKADKKELVNTCYSRSQGNDKKPVVDYLKNKYASFFDTTNMTDDELLEMVRVESNNLANAFALLKAMNKEELFLMYVSKYDSLSDYIISVLEINTSSSSYIKEVDEKYLLDRKDTLLLFLSKLLPTNLLDKYFNSYLNYKSTVQLIFKILPPKDKETVANLIFKNRKDDDFYKYIILVLEFGYTYEQAIEKFIANLKDVHKTLNNVSSYSDDAYAKYYTPLVNALFMYMYKKDFFTMLPISYTISGAFEKYLDKSLPELVSLREQYLQVILSDGSIPDASKLGWLISEKHLEDILGLFIPKYNLQDIHFRLNIRSAGNFSTILKYIIDNKLYDYAFKDKNNKSRIFDNINSSEDLDLILLNKDLIDNNYKGMIYHGEHCEILFAALNGYIRTDNVEYLYAFTKFLKDEVNIRSLIEYLTTYKSTISNIVDSIEDILTYDPSFDDVLLYIQQNDKKLFTKILYGVKKNILTSDIYSAILLSDKNPLPLLDTLSVKKNIKNFLSVNDSSIQLDEKSLASAKRFTKGTKFLDYVSHLRSSAEDVIAKAQVIIPEPKVEEVVKTEQELKETAFDINLKYNTQKHGDMAIKVLREWNYVTTPEQEAEIQSFIAAHPTTEILEHCFHSCGTLAGNMILRYWFSLSGKVEKVAKGLGPGIYFAPIIEKSLGYLGDDRYDRTKGTKGYVLECTLYLGDIPENYNDAIGTGWVSAEYVVRDPIKQIRINKVYYAELVGIRGFIDELEAKGMDKNIETGMSRSITNREKGSKYGK